MDSFQFRAESELRTAFRVLVRSPQPVRALAMIFPCTRPPLPTSYVGALFARGHQERSTSMSLDPCPGPGFVGCYSFLS